MSPTVSVHRQQRLYDYLLQRIPEKGPEDFLPFHPLDDRAYQRLLVIFRRLHTYLLGLSRSDQGHKYYATIGQLWMRGTPLPVIIQRSHEFKIRRHPGASLATTIRNVLGEIEDALRFKYVRLTSCYNAVLQYAFQKLGYSQLVSRIAQLPLYLEIGASSGSMVSFMSLGLSRIAAARLADFTTKKNMNREDALDWLRAQDISILDLSPIIANEIMSILSAVG